MRRGDSVSKTLLIGMVVFKHFVVDVTNLKKKDMQDHK